MKECKLCGQKKKLIRSHIIPKCISKKLGKLVIVQENGFTKQRPDGIYAYNEHAILCKKCDELIGRYDEVGGSFLNSNLHTQHEFRAVSDEKGLGLKGMFCLRSIDQEQYRDLKLFFLSVLWRMSVTSDPSSKKIDLGPFYNERIRQALQQRLNLDTTEFPVWIFKLDASDNKFDLEKVIMGPKKVRTDRWRGYDLSFPGYQVGIKIDSQDLEESYYRSAIALNPNGIWNIGVFDWNAGNNSEDISTILIRNKAYMKAFKSKCFIVKGKRKKAV